MNGPAPKISIVIPTLGRATLIRTLDTLAAVRGFDAAEVLVVGDWNEREVAERVQAILKRHPNVRHVPAAFPTGDSSRKKNLGWQTARADMVVFIDDDVVMAPDWLERLMEPFADPEIGWVSGPALVPDDISPMARLAGTTLASIAAGYVAERYTSGRSAPRPAKWSRLIGCNMAWRKSVLQETDGFSADFWPGEEMKASHDAAARGRRFVFHPGAPLWHYPRTSLWRFVKQVYGYGATRIRLFRNGVEFEPTTILPALLLAGFLLLLAASFVWPWARWALAFGVAGYLLACLAAALWKVVETRRAIDLLIVLTIPLMHAAYGAAEWAELLFPNRDMGRLA